MTSKIYDIDLYSFSVPELRMLARKCERAATELESGQPSHEMALAKGIHDCGYNTVRYGWVSSFKGNVDLTMPDGSVWRAIGHGPTGTAEYVSRSGWIEFIRLTGIPVTI